MSDPFFFGFITGALTYGWILPAVGKIIKKLREKQ